MRKSDNCIVPADFHSTGNRCATRRAAGREAQVKRTQPASCLTRIPQIPLRRRSDRSKPLRSPSLERLRSVRNALISFKWLFD